MGGVSALIFLVLSADPFATWHVPLTRFGEFLVRDVMAQGMHAAPEGSVQLAATCIALASVTAVVLGILARAAASRRWAVYAMVALGILELVVFARVYRGTFSFEELERPEFAALLRDHPGDYRVMDFGGTTLAGTNYAVRARANAIWGYDPVMLWRYAEFIRLTQDYPASTSGSGMTTWAPEWEKPIYTLLRCRFVILPQTKLPLRTFLLGNGAVMAELKANRDAGRTHTEYPNPAPRFFVVQQYEVETEPQAIVKRLTAEDFDFRSAVILESEPVPVPGAGGAGAATAGIEVLDESTDHVSLEVTLPEAAILVITDAYSSGWRVVPLDETPLQDYTVMPANLAIRAIPLAAGQHRFRMEYAPAAYRVGKWVSIASTAVFALVVLGWALRARRRSRVDRGNGADQAG